MNGDYIPLDQAVIDQAVEQLQKKRNEARGILAEAYKDKDTGGNLDIIVFRPHDFGEFKRIIKALEEVRLFWCDIDRDIYVNRHEFYEAIGQREIA